MQMFTLSLLLILSHFDVHLIMRKLINFINLIVFKYLGYVLNLYRIGFSIARRLAQEGAKVMISSRKETNVKRAVETLKSEGLQVAGTVCHVGKREDRKNLFEKVRGITNYHFL